MDDRHLALFNESLDRCSSRSGFLDRFYELFLASSDEIAKKFEKTDFKKQVRMLKVSLYVLMVASSGKPEFDVPMEELATLHDRSHLNIKPELYDQWLDCLLQAVEEFDPSFDTEIETAWRTVLQHGIDFMRSRY